MLTEEAGSRSSWEGSGTAPNVTWAETKGEGLSLTAAPEERRVEISSSQLLPHRSLAQGHTGVSKAGLKTRQPGHGKEAGGKRLHVGP